MLPDPRRCLLLLVTLGAALGVCGCAGFGGPGGAAPGFFDHVAGGLSNLGDHMRAAGAAVAPASPQVGAALLAIGGGLSTIGTYWGALLLRRRLGNVPAAVVAAIRTPPPSSPPAAQSIASVSTVDAARVDTANLIPVSPVLASPKAKRKRTRRPVAAAPFSARIAPAQSQQTSGRAAA